jgi:putative membrane protein
MPTHLLTTLPAFLAYFAVAMGLLVLFLLVYLNVTPYHEVALIRAGNAAAAVSLAGALLVSRCRWPTSSPIAIL